MLRALMAAEEGVKAQVVIITYDTKMVQKASLRLQRWQGLKIRKGRGTTKNTTRLAAKFMKENDLLEDLQSVGDVGT
jgi:predicted urease superfamily metal-dependent hydrolase